MKRQLYHNLLDIVLRDRVDSKNQFYHLQNFPIQEHFVSKSKSTKTVYRIDYKILVGYLILLMIALVIVYLIIKYISNVVNHR